MENGRRVLVVDELTDTADVLRAVLEPRGLRVDEATRPSLVEPALSKSHLAVVVVDEESAELRCVDRSGWGDAPRVIIGTVPLPEATDSTPRERFLLKPFHYADLLRAIDSLIAEDAA